MGLDMYLTRKTYVKNWKHNEMSDGTPEWQITIKHNGKETNLIDSSRISFIEEEIITWRKANAIHKWFVENVQDGEDNCADYYVETEKLEELRDLCKKVLDTAILKDGVVQNGSSMLAGETEFTPDFESGKMIMNAEEVSKILPTTGGFFYGSTEYDQWYYSDVKETYEALSEVLSEQNTGDFYYSSSW